MTRWLMPDRLAARFVLLLAAALIAASVVAAALLVRERERLDRDARELREVERVLSVIPVLEAVDPERRRGIARSASTRFTRVQVQGEAVLDKSGTDLRSRMLLRQVVDALPDRDVRAAVIERRRWVRQPDDDDDKRHPAFRAETITISVALAVPPGLPPQWLNIASANIRPDGPDGAGRIVFLVLILSLVAVLGVGLVFVRLLTRPLAQLSDAARAAGRGDRSVRVPETGARELRAAAHAFNDMQDRIARFDAERTRTLAAVGHDLRTPITSLRIRAEMLDDADMSAQMVRTLDEMTVMADGLVAYARGEAGEDSREIDLGACLERLCVDRGAALTVARQARVIGRPVALGRAIGNLIDNALRYGCGAEVGLDVEGDAAIVTVADRGPGIPEDRLDAMFDPFVRGEESRSADTGGAGLGLSIARSVIVAHGGEVRLANRDGGGLEARVSLPLAKGG